MWFFDVVGWCGAYSRIFWKSKGGRDAVASICGKTLPHSAGRELKPSHAGRGGWVPAESLSRDLEGRLLVVTITYTELYSHSLQNRTELYEYHNWLVDEGYVLHTHTHTHTYIVYIVFWFHHFLCFSKRWCKFLLHWKIKTFFFSLFHCSVCGLHPCCCT